MDLIAGYGGDDEPAPEPTPGVAVEGAQPTTKTTEEEAVNAADIPPEMLTGFDEMRSKMMVNLAPVVKEKEQVSRSVVDPKSHLVFHNPKIEELYAPLAGPSAPGGRLKVAPGQLNTLTGFVEDDSLSDAVFKQQFVQFNNRGYAVDPSQGNFGYGAYVMAQGAQQIAVPENPAPRRRKKRNDNPEKDPANVDEYKGPWALAGQDRGLAGLPQTEEGDAEAGDENAGQKDNSDEEGAAPAPKRQRRNKEQSAEVGGVFHGTAMRDSLNKSWIEPPAGLKDKQDKRLARVRGEDISSDVIKMMQAGSEGDLSGKDIAKKWKPSSDVTCYLPKRVIHEWKGHEGPVWKSTLFPRYGHMMMSCSTDKTIKIWDYHNQKKCLMTYYGHNGAVKDISFSSDGSKFTSASFDRDVRLWDTETGKCLGTFSNGSIPNVVRMHPNSDNDFLVGTSNKRVLQWDARENKIAQEYDRHLGAVNTITYTDDARRFVTTSDDKTILIWEWGIAVDIKRIADPSMNSMPAVGVHPNGKWLLMQSLDNQILTYGARDKFRLNNRKIFKGHINAGFAIQPNMSPDGRYVISGDHEGRLWIWDWKTTQRVALKSAHDKVLIYSEWHPHESSRVITASWDGTIKLWD